MDTNQFFRKITKSTAKLAKACDNCKKTWNSGDNIYVLSDPFEMFCLTCGDVFIKLKQDGELKINTTDNTVLATLQRIERKLDQLLGEII